MEVYYSIHTAIYQNTSIPASFAYKSELVQLNISCRLYHLYSLPSKSSVQSSVTIELLPLSKHWSVMGELPTVLKDMTREGSTLDTKP